MATSREVIAWSTLWRLDDVTVICRSCGALQMEVDQEQPFPHLDTCLPRSEEQFPWKAFD